MLPCNFFEESESNGTKMVGDIDGPADKFEMNLKTSHIIFENDDKQSYKQKPSIFHWFRSSNRSDELFSNSIPFIFPCLFPFSCQSDEVDRFWDSSSNHHDPPAVPIN
jgi:hypothetical protein